MTSKFANFKLFTIIAVSLLAIFVIADCSLLFYISQKNNKVIDITQSDVFLDKRTNLRYYGKITTTRAWVEEPEFFGGVYTCTIYNTSNSNLTNLKVKIKLPQDSILISSWNGITQIVDNTIFYKPEADNSTLNQNSSISFGFILGANEHIDFSSIQITGKIIYKIRNFWLHNMLLTLIICEIISVTLVFLSRMFMQKRINQLNEEKKRTDELIDQTMKTFVNFIDSKDDYTRGHSVRVGRYSRIIAREMGFDEQFQKDIYYMGLMHDIGKMTIPDEILNKTTHLSTDEWEIIKMHTRNGATLLKDFSIMPSIKDAVLFHHERYDGKGYLSQLKGDAIPLTARIICVADSFDAMNTNRCYRLKYSQERILQELERCSGKQFDPEVAAAMINAIKDGLIIV